MPFGGNLKGVDKDRIADSLLQFVEEERPFVAHGVGIGGRAGVGRKTSGHGPTGPLQSLVRLKEGSVQDRIRSGLPVHRFTVDHRAVLGRRLVESGFVGMIVAGNYHPPLAGDLVRCRPFDGRNCRAEPILHHHGLGVFHPIQVILRLGDIGLPIGVGIDEVGARARLIRRHVESGESSCKPIEDDVCQVVDAAREGMTGTGDNGKLLGRG